MTGSDSSHLTLTKYLLIHESAVIFDACDDGREHEVALRGGGRRKGKAILISAAVQQNRQRSSAHTHTNTHA